MSPQLWFAVEPSAGRLINMTPPVASAWMSCTS
jgi:hypothetical protein